MVNNTQATSVRYDVNQDGVVNTTDSMLILRYSLNLPMNNTSWQNVSNVGDVNCDNVSNTIDALLVLKKSLGFDIQVPECNTIPTVSNVTINGIPKVGEVLTLNYNFNANGVSEGDSIIVWSSEYGELQRGTSKTLTLTKKYGGNHIKAEIYPKDINGNESTISFSANNNGLKVEYTPTYFIDSVNGNDSNNGQSSQTPWKTLAIIKQKILNNELVPGDVIAFKAGSEFNDNFLRIININGTSENPIVLTSYGTGEKPIFNGIGELNTTWTYEGNNIYSTNGDNVLGNRLWINGVEQKRTGDTPNNGCVALGEVNGAEKGCRELGENAVFTRDLYNHKMYLYSLSNPSTLNLETASTYDDIEIRNSEFVIIDGLDLRGSYQTLYISESNNIIVKNSKLGAKASIGVMIKNSDSVIIERNDIDSDWNVDYDIEDYFPKLKDDIYYPKKYTGIDYRGVEDGITSYRNISNFTIRYNNFKNWGHSGITITTGKDGNYEANNNKIYNNIFTSPDIWYGRAFAISGKETHDNEIYNNYIYDLPIRNQVSGHDNKIHNNLIKNIRNSNVKDGDLSQAIAIENYAGIAENNIFSHNTFKNIDNTCVEIFDWYSLSLDREISKNEFNWNLFENCGIISNNLSLRIHDRPNIKENNIFRNNLFLDSTQNTISYKGNEYSPELFNDTFNENADNGEDRIFGNKSTVNANELNNYGTSNFDFNNVGFNAQY